MATSSAALAYAREHLAGQRVVGRAMPENRASIHVLEKVGLAFEGTAEEDGCLLLVYVMR